MDLSFAERDHVLLVGDNRETLTDVPDGIAQMIATSPPYFGLRLYGDDGSEIGKERDLDAYVQSIVDVMRLCRDKLRDDGTAWVNLGDSYASSTKGSGGKDPSKSTLGRRASGEETMTDAGKQQGLDRQHHEPIAVDCGLPAGNALLVPFRVATALQADGWTLRAMLPWVKCLSGGTRVYARTQKGEMPATLKDLVRLDPATVQLWNGERWTQVLSWSPSPRTGTEIEIELRSGERVGTTLEHLWPTSRGLVEARDLRPGDVMRTCALPEPADARRPAALDDEDIGWLVGFYLAEGNRTRDGVTFAMHAGEREYADRIARIAAAYDCTFRFGKRHGNGASAFVYGPVIAGILDAYITGATSHDKHLSMRAWKRSNVFLRALAHGYLDGDGHHDRANNRWRLGFCNNDALAADLRTLAARLGGRVRLRRCSHLNQDTGKKHPGYKGEWRFDPVAGSNIPNTFRPSDNGEIVAIRPSRARMFWDVLVADDPHLFALASGVLTHNCASMPESVQSRPCIAHEYVLFLTKRPSGYFYDADAVRVPNSPGALEHYERYSPRRNEISAAKGRGLRETGAANHQNGNGGLGVNPAGRSLRSSDIWRAGAREAGTALLAAAEGEAVGMLTNDDGPAAFIVNPKGSGIPHFAMWPTRLVAPMILAGTPEAGCCSVCGAPWMRDVERALSGLRDGRRPVRDFPGNAQKVRGGDPSVRTLGFRPSCDHDAPAVPAVVLDPFAGACTSMGVASALGRRSIGCELYQKNANLAPQRIDIVRTEMVEYLREIGDTKRAGDVVLAQRAARHEGIIADAGPLFTR